MNMGKQARFIYGSTEPRGEAANMDLRWRIGMALPDPHLFLEYDSEGILLASSLEFTRAKQEARRCRVESQEPYLERAEERTIAALLKAWCVMRGVDTLEAHPETHCGLVEKLREKGIAVVVGKAPWYPERVVKTGEEIRWIEEVQRAVEEVLWDVKRWLGQAYIHKGLIRKAGEAVTSEMVRQFIEKELFVRGCVAEHTIVASGADAAQPHNEGSRPLRGHAPIIFDIFPYSRETGYYADMTRTFFKGVPTFGVKRLYETVLQGQELGIRMARAGIDGSDIHKKIFQFFELHGYKTDRVKGSGFIHGTGHGLGLQYHEPPSIARISHILLEGAVVTVEPGLYYPDEEMGIRIEDMVVVEKGGCRNLTQFPKGLNDVIIP